MLKKIKKTVFHFTMYIFFVFGRFVVGGVRTYGYGKIGLCVGRFSSSILSSRLSKLTKVEKLFSFQQLFPFVYLAPHF